MHTELDERLAVRNAAAMAMAQLAYDNRAEPEADPHYMHPDDAEEIAQSECMATGYTLAWSLGELCDHGEPDDVDMLCRHGFDAHGKSAQTLLAVMFNAEKPADILAARAALREMIAAETSMREAVVARAEALQAEGWL